MGSLINKRVLLGVTGGIAAYKSADLVRRLRDAGAEVRVIMTRSATEFITPLTLQAVSGHPVHQQLLDTGAEAGMAISNSRAGLTPCWWRRRAPISWRGWRRGAPTIC